MKIDELFAFPLQNPVVIFALVLVIILLSPIILRRLRIPGIIGLILAGVIIGPNGLNILERDSSIVLFGTVGLLYIMFLAGLEIDMIQFKRSRYKSLLFGLLTFSIPQTIGTLIGYYYLNFSLLSSILLASMFASHTLLTYPIVSKLGINRIEAVTVAIGGTLITDTLALFLLSVIVQIHKESITPGFWAGVVFATTIFAVLIFWGIPKLARWFFKVFAREGYSHFLFVLSLVFVSAFLAQLAYLEAIIGAFLAGISLNRLIPGNSSLMNRIEFVGNTLFIPFFLIGTGMIVDLRVFLNSTESIKVALVMIVVATTTKWLAAFFTQKILGYNAAQRQIIFGLSNSQAAATLAAITIGYEIGLLNENVLNGTILMILVTCLIASFATEASGRKLALELNNHPDEFPEKPERILVPVSNPQNIDKLIDLAMLIRDPKLQDPIYALTIVKDAVSADKQIAACKMALGESIKHATAAEANLQLVTRIDINISGAIVRAMHELQITTSIIGWNAKMTTQEKIFGGVFDNILHDSTQTLMVCKILSPLNTLQKINLFIPVHAHYEKGFMQWLKLIKTLCSQAGARLEVNADKETSKYLKKGLSMLQPQIAVSYIETNAPPDIARLSKSLLSNVLYVFVSTRRTSISYHQYLDEIPYELSKYFEAASFIVLYPEQISGAAFESTLRLDEDSMFPYQKSMSIINKLKNLFSTQTTRHNKK